jgi:colanic acid/amylovoran biosynthesis protein
MKTVITNTVVLNGGDAAILKGLLETLRLGFGDALEQPTVFDSQPEAAARYHPGVRYRPLLWNRFRGPFKEWQRNRAVARLRARMAVPWIRGGLRLLHECDAVISTGGTYLVETYDLSARLFEFEAAMAVGRPPLFFTQSLGPFRAPENRRRLLRVFDASPLILLRDECSAQHLEDLGVRSHKIHVRADGAFILTKPASLAAARRACIGDRPRVAISVRSWSRFEGRSEFDGMSAYLDSVCSLATELVRQGMEVTFLSTCQGVPEYWLDDSETATLVVQRASKSVRSHMRVDRSFRTPEDLQLALESFDAIIATRFHAAILALSVGTPVLPIAYEFKTVELFNRLGLADYVLDINSITPDQAVDCLRGFLRSFDSLRAHVLDAVEREHQSAVGTAALIRDALA